MERMFEIPVNYLVMIFGDNNLPISDEFNVYKMIKCVLLGITTNLKVLSEQI